MSRILRKTREVPQLHEMELNSFPVFERYYHRTNSICIGLEIAKLSHQFKRLVNFIESNAPICVITGAGCSTDSGIFDYRDLDGNWKRPPPVQLQEFLHSAAASRQYWSRSMLAWPRFATAKPNLTHYVLVRLEQLNLVGSVISQNVDDLHADAGQQRLINLHGSLSTVSCLACHARISRNAVQSLLERNNKKYLKGIRTTNSPDEAEYVVPIDSSFWIPDCPKCGGMLKPDVVFFGESVPSETVDCSYRAVDDSRGMLILGSSVMVYSSYRFVRRAHETGLAIASVNQGKSRAESWLDLNLNKPLNEVMHFLASEYGMNAR